MMPLQGSRRTSQAMKYMAEVKLALKLGCTELSKDLIPGPANLSDREVAQVCQLLKHAKDPQLR